MFTQDKIFKFILGGVAIATPLILLALFAVLIDHSNLIWKKDGFSFLINSEWNPVMELSGSFSVYKYFIIY